MTKEAADAQPRYMANLKLFSSKLEDTKSGGLIVRDVLTLGEGKWHASNWPWPVYYSPSELEKATVSENSLWDGHQNKSPTGKVGHFMNQHYDPARKGIVADVFLHGRSTKSRDLIEMVKAGAAGEIDPLWVSVEHTSNDFYNKDLDQYEARGIDIMGLAVVDSGACRTCRLNENNTNHSKGMDLEPKELEQVTSTVTTKVTETVTKELSEVKAKNADLEKQNKELSEALAKEAKARESVETTVKALAERVEKIEKTPLPNVGKVGALAAEDLIMLE